MRKAFPYVLASVVIIGLWQLLTWTDTYAWFPKGIERRTLDTALTTIFVYKASFWLIIANTLVFIGKSIFQSDYKTAGIASFAGVLFWFFAGKTVDRSCAFAYYTVFTNQSVGEEYLQNPIKEAGYYIGPILTEKIKDRQMEYRRYAIGGLGAIKYRPATETLQQLLVDRAEPDYIRADAYAVLAEFNSATSKQVLANFNASAIDSVDKKVVKLGTYFLQQK